MRIKIHECSREVDGKLVTTVELATTENCEYRGKMFEGSPKAMDIWNCKCCDSTIGVQKQIRYLRDDGYVQRVAQARADSGYTLKPITMMGKVNFGSASCEGVYELPNGVVVELYLSEFGFMRYAVVFFSREEWYKYVAPVPQHKLYKRGL